MPEDKTEPERPADPAPKSCDLTIEDIKANFDQHIDKVVEKIPSVFFFEEGESNNNIGDGGKDMFDGGNFLGTNLKEDFEYSND